MTDELEPRCAGLNARGERCEKPAALVNADGFCDSHGPNGTERMAELSKLGRATLDAKKAAEAFTVEELGSLVTLEDATHALDVIRVATLTRRITHHEANAASKAVSEWTKSFTASMTARVVNDLQKALDEKTAEIAALRQQLATHTGDAQRKLRAVR